MPSSSELLQRFKRGGASGIDLTLRPAYRALLKALGEPHQKLPPAFHVAGTNGKGSVCAFLRAIFEAAGHRVHVYTSPHLVTFHERIRIAGKLIEEADLAEILAAIERLSAPGEITFFEAATAAAFVAFARHPADFTILEVGLGGRLDATNVIEKPLATIIATLSFDHREYLGTTLAQIAREKAGIMRKNVSCFTAPQDEEAARSLRDTAAKIGAPLIEGSRDWRIETLANGFCFIDKTRIYNLPSPSLLGPHQLWNAGLAIAALPSSIPEKTIATGLQRAEWPARLQKLDGRLAKLLPPGWELWLDGGHNDSAGAALAAQIEIWKKLDGLPLDLVCGMLTTKNPREFLALFAPQIRNARAVNIPDEPLAFPATELVTHIREAGVVKVEATENIEAALAELTRNEKPGRILICGSLYLAGTVLKKDK